MIKLKQKLEKILAATVLVAGTALFSWMGYDSLNSRIQIEKEAQDRGVSVYEVCKEKGRSDVVDMIEAEQGVKNIGGYVWLEDAAIPMVRHSEQPTPQPASQPHERKISHRGLDLIKEFEGYSPQPYRCQAGKMTIGYGHMIKRGEKFGRINREQAEKLLEQDVSVAEETIKNHVKVPLTRNQYDAVCSFVYNTGAYNFGNSTLLRKLNSRDYNGAASEFLKWVNAAGKKSEGLERRRLNEKRLFSTSE